MEDWIVFGMYAIIPFCLLCSQYVVFERGPTKSLWISTLVIDVVWATIGVILAAKYLMNTRLPEPDEKVFMDQLTWFVVFVPSFAALGWCLWRWPRRQQGDS